MRIFRSQDTAPAGSDDPSAYTPPDPQEEGARYPARESHKLSQTVERLVGSQDAFLANCKSRGLTAEDATAAFTAGIREGALPAAFTVQTRRDNTRDLFFVHGTPPDGLLEISEYDGRFYMDLGDSGPLDIPKRLPDRSDLTNGSTWRPSPDGYDWRSADAAPENVDDFYLEYHKIDPGHTPNYGDERDQPLAFSFREVNDRLSQMLPVPEAP